MKAQDKIEVIRRTDGVRITIDIDRYRPALHLLKGKPVLKLPEKRKQT